MGNGMSFWFDYQLEYGCVVQTKTGTIKGKTFLFKEGNVNCFLGVPFAKNGIYQNRFQKPKPVDSWKGVYDCTRFGPRSIQFDMFWDLYITPIRQNEENCLNLNIFAPTWSSKEFPNGRPVMVFVHGGGYLIHSNSNYGDYTICKNLCLRDVCVCVIQYRLGLLGFLSLPEVGCLGNFGLWDQIAAFKWIKENISLFGGDPNNITAFGQSAGAASVDLLSLSPYSEGLFQRIILMGGNANTEWSIVKPERTQEGAMSLLKKFGWNCDLKPNSIKNQMSLLEFAKSAPSWQLRAPLIGKSAFNGKKNGLQFCPVLDKDLLPGKSIEELRKKARKITVIIGTAEYEALLFHALGKSQADHNSIKKFLQIQIPDTLPNYTKLREEAFSLYTDGIDFSKSEQVARAFIKLYSDILMNNSTQKYCQEMVDAGHTVYLYNMTYFNPESFGIFTLRMPFLAATHCHDLRYIMGKGLYSKFRPNYDDLEMLDKMTTFWTNFAKYDDPNGSLKATNYPAFTKWEKQTPKTTYNHMNLNLQPIMEDNYQGRTYEFWAKIDALSNDYIDTKILNNFLIEVPDEAFLI